MHTLVVLIQLHNETLPLLRMYMRILSSFADDLQTLPHQQPADMRAGIRTDCCAAQSLSYTHTLVMLVQLHFATQPLLSVCMSTFSS